MADGRKDLKQSEPEIIDFSDAQVSEMSEVDLHESGDDDADRIFIKAKQLYDEKDYINAREMFQQVRDKLNTLENKSVSIEKAYSKASYYLFYCYATSIDHRADELKAINDAIEHVPKNIDHFQYMLCMLYYFRASVKQKLYFESPKLYPELTEKDTFNDLRKALELCPPASETKKLIVSKIIECIETWPEELKHFNLTDLDLIDLQKQVETAAVLTILAALFPENKSPNAVKIKNALRIIDKDKLFENKTYGPDKIKNALFSFNDTTQLIIDGLTKKLERSGNITQSEFFVLEVRCKILQKFTLNKEQLSSAYNGLAFIERWKNEFPKARDLYSLAINAFSKPEYYYHRALVSQTLVNREENINDLEIAILLQENYGPAIKLLAQLTGEAKDLPFKDENKTEEQRLSVPNFSKEAIKEWIESNDHESEVSLADEAFIRGKDNLDLNNPQESLKEFMTVLKELKNFNTEKSRKTIGKTWHYIALCYILQNKHEAAISALNKAMNHFPLTEPYRLLRCETLHQRAIAKYTAKAPGEFDKKIQAGIKKDFENALEICATESPLRLKILNDVIKIFEILPPEFNKFRLPKDTTNSPEPMDALEQQDESADIEDTKIDQAYEIGMKYFENEQYGDALPIFRSIQTMLQNKQGYSMAFLYEGRCLLNLNDPKAALDAFDKALATAPQNPAYQLKLLGIYQLRLSAKIQLGYDQSEDKRRELNNDFLEAIRLAEPDSAIKQTIANNYIAIFGVTRELQMLADDALDFSNLLSDAIKLLEQIPDIMKQNPNIAIKKLNKVLNQVNLKTVNNKEFTHALLMVEQAFFAYIQKSLQPIVSSINSDIKQNATNLVYEACDALIDISNHDGHIAYTYFAMGVLDGNRAQDSEALLNFSSAISIDKQDMYNKKYLYLFYRASTLDKLGYIDKAIKDLRLSIDLNSNFPNAQEYLAKLLIQHAPLDTKGEPMSHAKPLPKKNKKKKSKQKKLPDDKAISGIHILTMESNQAYNKAQVLMEEIKTTSTSTFDTYIDALQKLNLSLEKLHQLQDALGKLKNKSPDQLAAAAFNIKEVIHNLSICYENTIKIINKAENDPIKQKIYISQILQVWSTIDKNAYGSISRASLIHATLLQGKDALKTNLTDAQRISGTLKEISKNLKSDDMEALRYTSQIQDLDTNIHQQLRQQKASEQKITRMSDAKKLDELASKVHLAKNQAQSARDNSIAHMKTYTDDKDIMKTLVQTAVSHPATALLKASHIIQPKPDLKLVAQLSMDGVANLKQELASLKLQDTSRTKKRLTELTQEISNIESLQKETTETTQKIVFIKDEITQLNTAVNTASMKAQQDQNEEKEKALNRNDDTRLQRLEDEINQTNLALQHAKQSLKIHNDALLEFNIQLNHQVQNARYAPDTALTEASKILKSNVETKSIAIPPNRIQSLRKRLQGLKLNNPDRGKRKQASLNSLIERMQTIHNEMQTLISANASVDKQIHAANTSIKANVNAYITHIDSLRSNIENTFNQTDGINRTENQIDKALSDLKEIDSLLAKINPQNLSRDLGKNYSAVHHKKQNLEQRLNLEKLKTAAIISASKTKVVASLLDQKNLTESTKDYTQHISTTTKYLEDIHKLSSDEKSFVNEINTLLDEAKGIFTEKNKEITQSTTLLKLIPQTYLDKLFYLNDKYSKYNLTWIGGISHIDLINNPKLTFDNFTIKDFDSIIRLDKKLNAETARTILNEISAELLSDGFKIIHSKPEFVQFKQVEDIKGPDKSKDIEITVAAPIYRGEQFITGFNMAKLRFFNDKNITDADRKNYALTSIGDGRSFGIEVTNAYHPDFKFACEKQKFLVAKRNPYFHEKYYLHVVKNYEKMCNVFGFDNVNITSDPSDPEKAGDGSTPLISYGQLLQTIDVDILTEYKVSEGKRIQLCQELNSLIKGVGLTNPYAKPFIKALLKAMLFVQNKKSDALEVEEISEAAFAALASKYQNNIFTAKTLRIAFQQAIGAVITERRAAEFASQPLPFVSLNFYPPNQMIQPPYQQPLQLPPMFIYGEQQPISQPFIQPPPPGGQRHAGLGPGLYQRKSNPSAPLVQSIEDQGDKKSKMSRGK